MSRVTAFLSHSSKDIQKVRKIRDILEMLDYEPLLFYLKCLDDDNTNLESFIKREIEARNIFIYCKSNNSEKSAWVQKELEYIKSFDSKRLFTIDISLPFRETMVQLLQSIADIVKKNRIFFSCSHGLPDARLGDVIENVLAENNFDVIRFKTLDYQGDFEHKKALAEANIFIPIISPNSLASVYCRSELEYALYEYEKSPSTFTNKIVPIYCGISGSLVVNSSLLPSSLRYFTGVDIQNNSSITLQEEQILLRLLC